MSGTIRRGGKYANISKNVKPMIIKLYEEGNTIAEVFRIMSVNINTTKTIISWYKKNDFKLVEFPRKKIGNKSNPPNPGKNWDDCGEIAGNNFEKYSQKVIWTI